MVDQHTTEGWTHTTNRVRDAGNGTVRKCYNRTTQSGGNDSSWMRSEIRVSGQRSEVNLPEHWPALPFLTQMSSWTPQFRSPPGKIMQFQWATLWWRKDKHEHTLQYEDTINTGCWHQRCIWIPYVSGPSVCCFPLQAIFINCIKGLMKLVS